METSTIGSAASVRMSDDALWPRIAASDGTAVVGLKARDRNRGVRREEVLVDAEGTRRAERAVLASPGVSAPRHDRSAPRAGSNATGLTAIGVLPLEGAGRECVAGASRPAFRCGDDAEGRHRGDGSAPSGGAAPA